MRNVLDLLRKASSLLFILVLASAFVSQAQGQTDKGGSGVYVLPLDEAGQGGWARDRSVGGAQPADSQAQEPASTKQASLRVVHGAEGRDELAVEADFPGGAGVIRNVGDDREAWGKGRVFRARIFVPVEAGPYPTAQLAAYHYVYGWFAAVPTRALEPGKWTTVYWQLSGDNPDWVSANGAVAWNDTLRWRLERVGLRVFSGGEEPQGGDLADQPDASDGALASGASDAPPQPVEIRITDLAIEGVDDPPAPLAVSGFRASTETATVGRRFEMAFDLTRWYENPFDPDCVAVDVDFSLPSGKRVSLPAFYCQDYSRRRLADDTEAYDARGRSQWRARFTPADAGRHTFQIRIKDKFGGGYKGPEQSFDVAAAPFTGFVRVDRNDPEYLSFTNGGFFYPIGLIVRSPDDDRRQYDYEFDLVPGRGLAVYDEYFTSMSQHGLNFTRVWMGAWWTALEWSHGYRTDYPGLGQYNQLNAWRLDYIVEQAENHGIYIDLTLHNHGQFRHREFDDEWYDNPYFKGQGGPVDYPDEFWTDETARSLLRKRLRYIVARWSYSPAIAWWELCNEVDLISNYDTAKVLSWHRAMAQYLKKIDPYRHVVAMHYTYNRLDPMIQALPENEICQSTGYNADMVERLAGMYRDHHVFEKPVYLNEYGVGNSHNELRHNLHAGLWASTVIPYCGAALFWWWPYVHVKNEYPQYEALARFHAGEDYRGKDYQRSQPAPARPVPGVEILAMQNTESARLWIYDQRIYRSGAKRRLAAPTVRTMDASQWRLDNLTAGRYKIEFWDTWKGGIVSTRETRSIGGALLLDIPAFESDIACKIDPVK